MKLADINFFFHKQILVFDPTVVFFFWQPLLRRLRNFLIFFLLHQTNERTFVEK